MVASFQWMGRIGGRQARRSRHWVFALSYHELPIFVVANKPLSIERAQNDQVREVVRSKGLFGSEGNDQPTKKEKQDVEK